MAHIKFNTENAHYIFHGVNHIMTKRPANLFKKCDFLAVEWPYTEKKKINFISNNEMILLYASFAVYGFLSILPFLSRKEEIKQMREIPIFGVDVDFDDDKTYKRKGSGRLISKIFFVFILTFFSLFVLSCLPGLIGKVSIIVLVILILIALAVSLHVYLLISKDSKSKENRTFTARDVKGMSKEYSHHRYLVTARNAIISERISLLAVSFKKTYGRRPTIGLVFGEGHIGIVELLKRESRRKSDLKNVLNEYYKNEAYELDKVAKFISDFKEKKWKVSQTKASSAF